MDTLPRAIYVHQKTFEEASRQTKYDPSKIINQMDIERDRKLWEIHQNLLARRIDTQEAQLAYVDTLYEMKKAFTQAGREIAKIAEVKNKMRLEEIHIKEFIARIIFELRIYQKLEHCFRTVKNKRAEEIKNIIAENSMNFLKVEYQEKEKKQIRTYQELMDNWMLTYHEETSADEVKDFERRLEAAVSLPEKEKYKPLNTDQENENINMNYKSDGQQTDDDFFAMNQHANIKSTYSFQGQLKTVPSQQPLIKFQRVQGNIRVRIPQYIASPRSNINFQDKLFNVKQPATKSIKEIVNKNMLRKNMNMKLLKLSSLIKNHKVQD